jgi:hypothetical protein
LRARNRENIGYDAYDSFLIEANSEEDARAIAQAQGGDETYHGAFWTSDVAASCQELKSSDFAPGEIIIASFNAG